MGRPHAGQTKRRVLGSTFPRVHIQNIMSIAPKQSRRDSRTREMAKPIIESLSSAWNVRTSGQMALAGRFVPLRAYR
ncbi:hypothetical protein GCM10018980_70400 [Streptomyces capoamus]|uniref:Uncharacterized protein n=1 Tax=Streptomyces capoamus TaxID=68183 RepID=A0A919F2S6_9ACTN|nr:hypothetical protein GCM10010501_17730 [Streptomyces libani subsp. rufus]GHG73869.1 hypothetical protein GCM10018980_70400 [Streptomyces capoamus]